MSETRAAATLDDSSEQANELFEALPAVVARGLVYLLVGILIAAALYATIGQLDEIVKAPAVLAPDGMVRPVQAPGGGRVLRVAAREGDTVEQDQALIYLDGEELQARLASARREREIREQQLQDLVAGQADGAQVAEARARLAQAEAELVTARRSQEAGVILAPAPGQVTHLAVHGPGETVQAGQTVAELAPAGAPLVFQARLPNTAIGRVKLDQRARVKVDAYPHHEYGALEGRVTFIAPDARAQGSEPATYQVTVTPITRPAAPALKEIPLRLGLSGTVEIVTRKRRIIDFIIKGLRGDSQ